MPHGKVLIYNTPTNPTPKALIWIGENPRHQQRFELLAKELKDQHGDELNFMENCLAFGRFVCNDDVSVFRVSCLASNYDGSVEPDCSDKAMEYFQKHYAPLVLKECKILMGQEKAVDIFELIQKQRKQNS